MRFNLEELNEHGNQTDELITDDAAEAWQWFMARKAKTVVITDNSNGWVATHSVDQDLFGRPQFNPIGAALNLRARAPRRSGTGQVCVRLPYEMIDFLTIKGKGKVTEGIRELCKVAMFVEGS